MPIKPEKSTLEKHRSPEDELRVNRKSNPTKNLKEKEKTQLRRCHPKEAAPHLRSPPARTKTKPGSQVKKGEATNSRKTTSTKPYRCQQRTAAPTTHDKCMN